MSLEQRHRVVGTSPPAKDATQKVCGTLTYPVDFELAGMLHGAILRSEHAHARILSIDASRALELPGVIGVVTHEDAPDLEWHGTFFNYRGRIFDRTARFVGDEIGAVAATSAEAAREALRHIDVEYGPLPAVFDAEAAMLQGAPQVQADGNARDPNIWQWGDLGAARSAASEVAAADVSFGSQQMAPMGRNAAIAQWSSGSVTLYTGTQTPSEVKDAIAEAFGMRRSRVRVVALPLGTSFGEFWSNNFMMVACLLARKVRRPVKIELSNTECMAHVKRRHEERCRASMGATADGDISFIDVHHLFDNGGYGFKNSVGYFAIDLWGARVPAGRFVCQGVSTNLVTAGCMRGVGDVTMGSVVERLADQLAERCGLDPLEFRIRNQIRPGDVLHKAWGGHLLRRDAQGYDRLIDESAAAAPSELRARWPELFRLSSGTTVEMLRSAAEEFGWEEKFVGWGRPYYSEGPIRRAVGVGTGIHCCGEEMEGNTDATVRIMKDGSVKLYCAVGRQGTCADTTQAMVAAETLGIALEMIEVEAGDTDACPWSRGSIASTTMFRTGFKTWAAALDAKRQLLELAGREVFDRAATDLDVRDGVIYATEALREADGGGHEPTGGVPIPDVMMRHREDTFGPTDSITGRPDFPMPPSMAFTRHFAAHFVDLEIDVETGQIRLLRYLAAQDSGTVVHPKVLEGQVIGAAVLGAGFALCEQLHFDGQGRVVNPTLSDYKVLRSSDFPPEAVVRFAEDPDPVGPYGARSAGEAPTAAPVPALAQAVYNAIGVWVDVPMTPERVLDALAKEDQAPAASKGGSLSPD
jgi:CO/xanthine dehydrogenase Mo-binding subunit